MFKLLLRSYIKVVVPATKRIHKGINASSMLNIHKGINAPSLLKGCISLICVLRLFEYTAISVDTNSAIAVTIQALSTADSDDINPSRYQHSFIKHPN